MALSTKTLIVRPEDVQGVPLGTGSPTAGVTVTAEYDRTIEAGAEVPPKGIRTPLKWDATAGHWGISLVASDDPAITAGQGACVIVRIEVQHRQGHGGSSGHSRGLTYSKTIQVNTADPALIPYGSKDSVHPVPAESLSVSPQQINDAAANASAALAAQQRLGALPFRKAAASGTARVAVLADSKGEGVGATARANRWQDKLREQLRSKTSLTADTGPGYLPAMYGHTGIAPAATIAGTRNDSDAADWAWIGNDGGPGNRAVHLKNATATVTYSAQNCRYVTVHYTQRPGDGTFELVVGGTVQATIDANGPVTDKVLSVDLGSVASRVVVIRWKSGGRVRVGGVSFRTALTGIGWLDATHSGWRADVYAYGNPEAPQMVARNMEQIAAFAPHLVIVALGANDMSGNFSQVITADQWKTALQALFGKIRAAVPNAGIVFLHGAQRIEDAKPTQARDYPGKLAEFEAAARAAAAADPFVTVLYESTLWAPRTTDPQDPLGWLADTVHPSDFGHAQIAKYLAKEIW